MKTAGRDPNRRDVLAVSTALATIAGLGADGSFQTAQAQQPARSASSGPPNIVYFLVDNLGYGELGCYGGGILRGADTKRIDAFATEGMKLLNFAPEAQCTPSRSALLTGRYAVRSGNHTCRETTAGLSHGRRPSATSCRHAATRRCASASGTSARQRAAGPPITALTNGMGRHAPGTNAMIPAGAPLDHVPRGLVQRGYER